MAARPRKNNVSVPNLYPLYSRKVNKVYWRYKHPVTGKFHALGTNEAEAIAIATEANTRTAEQRTRQILAISDRIATSKERLSQRQLVRSLSSDPRMTGLKVVI